MAVQQQFPTFAAKISKTTTGIQPGCLKKL